MVTVAPTGMSPVQTAPVAPIDKIPELAVAFPALVVVPLPVPEAAHPASRTRKAPTAIVNPVFT
jgi:hypothetical protein